MIGYDFKYSKMLNTFSQSKSVKGILLVFKKCAKFTSLSVPGVE